MNNIMKVKKNIEQDVKLLDLTKFFHKEKLTLANIKQNTDNTINLILRKLRQFGKQKDAIDLIQMENIINEELIKIVNSRQIQAHDEAPYDSEHTIEIKSSDEVTDGDNSYVPIKIIVRNTNSGLSVIESCDVYKKATAFIVIKITFLSVNQDKYKMKDLYPEDYQIMKQVKDIFNTSNITNMSEMFRDCQSLTSLDVSNFNTSNVTDMNGMFNNCVSLTTLYVSNWDTSNVTNMSYMFNNCALLTTLDVSNWDTSNVTNMSYMFGYCQSLTSLDVSNFNTSNATNMSYMFEYCNSLTTLDVSKWDTSNVTDMNGMFFYCNSLTTLDVSNFNTSNVTNMSYMFYGCSKLTTLDVSKFDTSKVTDMNQMFCECLSLTTIIGVIDMKSCTNYNNMFWDCDKLTGVKLKNVPTGFNASTAGLKEGQYTIVS